MSYDQQIQDLFAVGGQTAVITGGSGVLCSAMAHNLAHAGVKVAVVGRRSEAVENVARAIRDEGGQALSVAADVTDSAALLAVLEQVNTTFGPVDILINGAGGNNSRTVTNPNLSFFDLSGEAVEQVLNVNFTGTFKACQVFGRSMAERGQGCIINIASMASLRPLTRTPAYSAAKAAVANFTQWLAVHMAQEYSARIRVNALAPGFFLTEQNHALLIDEQSRNFTQRGQTIVSHTPQGRLGAPDDLLGTLLWLVSPASAFVTGIVVPVDGGFSAFAGV